MIHGNVYLDWKTGFAFSKPTGWDFETPEDPCRTFGGELIQDFDSILTRFRFA